MTTKRVESLRAPCLDASSTLATSTKNRRNIPSIFLFRWLGRSTGGVSGDLSAWWRIVVEAYCFAIVSLVRIVQKQMDFLFVYPPNACNYVARLRSNLPTSVASRLRWSFDSRLWENIFGCCVCWLKMRLLFSFRWLFNFLP